MSARLLVLLIGFHCVVSVYSASILDILTYDFEEEASPDTKPQLRETETSSATGRRCVCDGPSCICCVDFDLTYIDLGGPGCVRMKYLSAEDGIAVNVSYGESLLHSETVKGPTPKPTCISIFSKIAQMCARFTELLPMDDGMRGCLHLEPTLLGEPQLDFSVGCFKMGPTGMEMMPYTETETNSTIVEAETSDYNASESEPETVEGIDSSDTIGGLNAAQIIAAVNESAEEGIEFFSTLLGINFGKPDTSTNSTEEVVPAGESEEPEATPPIKDETTNEAQRSSKRIRDNLV